MNYNLLVKELPEGIITRKEIFEIAINTFNNEKLNTRWLITNLINKNYIEKLAKNRYKKIENNNSNLKLYKQKYSQYAKSLIQEIKHISPYIDFQIWELNCLNEFTRHLIGTNIIVIDVENDSCEFIYDKLKDKYKGKILLKPSLKELDHYLFNNSIIIDKLISQSPTNINNPHFATLEKILVDLIANKTLKQMIYEDDIPKIYQTAFNKYYINKNAMFRYAKRRNKYDDLVYLLQICKINL